MTKLARSASGNVLLLVRDNLYIANDDGQISFPSDFYAFRTPKIQYFGYCDDFGPMNAASIIDFIKATEEELLSHIGQKIVYVAESGVRSFTNAVFLMGCFLILKLKMDAPSVWDIFSKIPPEFIEGYRDATFSDGDFRLSLLDCWQGLARAQSIGWFDAPEKSNSKMWGDVCPQEYTHYENPLNGNLNIVVPGKFVAFQGPEDLPKGQIYRDSASKGRLFSAKYYVDIFDVIGVDDVVRLNEPRYTADTFRAEGIHVHELEFEDCTSPPPDVVSRFMEIADAAQGLIAVHCKAGLGRTGTLIALYLIRSFGFTAREAMGWLRIMRPGSVIGEQQHYLCEVERHLRGRCAAPAPRRRQPSPELCPKPTPPPPGALRLWSSASDLDAAAKPARASSASAAAAGAGSAAPVAGRKLPPLPTARAAAAAEKERQLSSARERAAEVMAAMAPPRGRARAPLSPPVRLAGGERARCEADAREITAGLARRAVQAGSAKSVGGGGGGGGGGGIICL